MSSSDMNRVRVLCELLEAAEDSLKQCKASLAEATERYNQIRMVDLPELMSEVGLTQVTLTDGTVVTIREEVNASISIARRPRAFAWLRENGFGGLIKTNVVIDTTHEEAERLIAQIADAYPNINLDEKVHPNTLKAFVKEQLAKGNSVPMELFGVHPYSIAKLERNEK